MGKLLTVTFFIARAALIAFLAVLADLNGWKLIAFILLIVALSVTCRLEGYLDCRAGHRRLTN